MATFPIPASYLDTGNGPGQVPVRDENAEIPGVPVVVHRTMTDEVARLVKLQAPSGWLAPGVLRGGAEVSPPVANTLYLDATNGAEVLLDGYRLPLPRNQVAITLPAPPTTGTRDDLVFLEAWFIRAEGSGRSLQYRFRVVSGVNFSSYPDGMDDPTVVAHDEQGNTTAAVYVQRPSAFDLATDPGLWVALRDGLENDILSEVGLDNELYRFTYALPIARVRRHNTTAYDAVTNPNGAPVASQTVPSTRPDGGWNDAVDMVRSVVDLRQRTTLRPNDDILFRRSLVDVLTNKLGGGVLQTTLQALDTVPYCTRRSDRAGADKTAITANLIKHSHFEVDTNADGVPDGWTIYTSGSATGVLALHGSTGEDMQRTGGPSGDPYGIKTTVTGVATDVLAVQVGYTVHSANGANLLIVVADPVTHNALATITIANLASIPFNTPQLQQSILNLPSWVTSFELRIYVDGGTTSLTLDYVDVRPEAVLRPVMQVTDGSFYPVLLPSALSTLGGSFDAGQSAMYDGTTGATIAGTIAVVSNNLEFRPAVPPTHADVRLVLGVSYAANSGVPVRFDSVLGASDVRGRIYPVPAASSSQTLSGPALGLQLATGEAVNAWNPGSAVKGTVATLRIPGNGTSTYTIAATKYGRTVLWPIDVRVNNVTTALFSSQRNSNGTVTIVLGGSTTVASNAYFEVDVVLDAPVCTWDAEASSVADLAEAYVLSTVAQGSTNTVTLAAPGMIKGKIASAVCASILLDGVAVSLALSVIVVIAGPLVTLTFPAPLTDGTKVQMIALVGREFVPADHVNVAVSSHVPLALTVDPSAALVAVSALVLVAHTKGTGGTDAAPDWGTAPFVRAASLDSRAIALINHTPVRSVLSDLPLAKNRCGSVPLQQGSVFHLSDLADASFLVESDALSTAGAHETVMLMLVSYQGRRLILVVRETRTDARTAVTSTASVALYEPNGRPVAIADPLP
jgi:hypothetical protein